VANLKAKLKQNSSKSSPRQPGLGLSPAQESWVASASPLNTMRQNLLAKRAEVPPPPPPGAEPPPPPSQDGRPPPPPTDHGAHHPPPPPERGSRSRSIRAT
jgi:hypothetical protein